MVGLDAVAIGHATYLKVREDGRVISMATVVAVGVRESDERKILGHDLGPARRSKDSIARPTWLRAAARSGWANGPDHACRQRSGRLRNQTEDIAQKVHPTPLPTGRSEHRRDRLAKCGVTNDVEFLREGLKTLAQAAMELEVLAKVGAEYHERSDNRT